MWRIIFVIIHVARCSTNCKGVRDRCAFPCKFQGRTYMKCFDNGIRSKYGDDPTQVTLVNSSVESVAECFERVGQFKVVRSKMSRKQGKDTYSMYTCFKDAEIDGSGDFIVRHRTKPKLFKDDPSICDVCDGKELTSLVTKDESLDEDCKAVTVPNLGCNIPSVCQETKGWQKRCPTNNKFDDGLCCEEFVDSNGKKRKRKCQM